MRTFWALMSDLPTPAALTPEDFRGASHVFVVESLARPRGQKMVLSDPDRAPELQALVARGVGGGVQEVQRALTRLLSMDVSPRSEVVFGRLPVTGQYIILVDEGVHSVEAEHLIVGQVHEAELHAAVERGESVPAEILERYRAAPGVSVVGGFS